LSLSRLAYNEFIHYKKITDNALVQQNHRDSVNYLVDNWCGRVYEGSDHIFGAPPLVLTVPQNATNNEYIRMVRMDERFNELNERITVTGLQSDIRPVTYVRLYPHGCAFSNPVMLEFHDVSINVNEEVCIMHRETELSPWEDITESVNPVINNGILSIRITKFCDFVPVIVPSILSKLLRSLFNRKSSSCFLTPYKCDTSDYLLVKCCSKYSEDGHLKNDFVMRGMTYQRIGKESVSSCDLVHDETLSFFLHYNGIDEPVLAHAPFSYDDTQSNESMQTFELPLMYDVDDRKMPSKICVLRTFDYKCVVTLKVCPERPHVGVRRSQEESQKPKTMSSKPDDLEGYVGEEDIPDGADMHTTSPNVKSPQVIINNFVSAPKFIFIKNEATQNRIEDSPIARSLLQQRVRYVWATLKEQVSDSVPPILDILFERQIINLNEMIKIGKVYETDTMAAADSLMKSIYKKGDDAIKVFIEACKEQYISNLPEIPTKEEEENEVEEEGEEEDEEEADELIIDVPE